MTRSGLINTRRPISTQCLCGFKEAEGIYETSSRHPRLINLSQLSLQLDELLLRVLHSSTADPLTAELADEIAATAGEVMVELADHREDILAKCVLEAARKLRSIVRTIRPNSVQVAEAGRALASDLQHVILDDRRAA